MAKNRINKKENKNIKTINPIDEQIKTGTAAYEKKTINPADDPIAKLFQPKVKLTYEKIAERAFFIWQNRGCLPNEDERNWREAETQLRVELGLD
jgi:hypothetical protein